MDASKTKAVSLKCYVCGKHIGYITTPSGYTSDDHSEAISAIKADDTDIILCDDCVSKKESKND